MFLLMVATLRQTLHGHQKMFILVEVELFLVFI
jgi:hypothetical protein